MGSKLNRRFTTVLGLGLLVAGAFVQGACRSNGSGATGQGGAGAGGAAGTGGSGADGGIDSAPPPLPGCLATIAPATMPAIFADFSACSATGCGFGGFEDGLFSGYTYTFNGLTSDYSNAAWHLSGDPGVAAIGFTCIVDASAFTGIQFTIAGDAGPSGQLLFAVSNAPDDDYLLDQKSPGQFGTKHAACHPVTSSYDGTCLDPTASVPVAPAVIDGGAADGGAAGTLVQVPFAALAGGKPHAMVDPTQLTGMQWRFAAPPIAPPIVDGVAVPYTVDVTIWQVSFY